mmetsp:Transcript_59776/g.142260  ORF Transcript_59776/g.142260 Transcript_59776/m.142260 type:complete len:301 (-) Transcript_59776:1613-2515(-)
MDIWRRYQVVDCEPLLLIGSKVQHGFLHLKHLLPLLLLASQELGHCLGGSLSIISLWMPSTLILTLQGNLFGTPGRRLVMLHQLEPLAVACHKLLQGLMKVKQEQVASSTLLQVGGKLLECRRRPNLCNTIFAVFMSHPMLPLHLVAKVHHQQARGTNQFLLFLLLLIRGIILVAGLMVLLLTFPDDGLPEPHLVLLAVITNFLLILVKLQNLVLHKCEGGCVILVHSRAFMSSIFEGVEQTSKVPQVLICLVEGPYILDLLHQIFREIPSKVWMHPEIELGLHQGFWILLLLLGVLLIL